MIMGVSVVIWSLSYSSDGNIEHSLIYAMGNSVEPIGLLFGLNWELLTAFIVSAMSKEAALGAIAMLFGIGSGVSSFTGGMISGALQYDQAGLSRALITGVPKAQALAFMVAFYYSVPCMAAIASSAIEARSYKWGMKIVAYYIIMALLLAGIAYRIGLLIRLLRQ